MVDILYEVSSDPNGLNGVRVVDANNHETAAELWADWFCHRNAEWPDSIECYVRRKEFGPRHRVEVSIKMVPFFTGELKDDDNDH